MPTSAERIDQVINYALDQLGEPYVNEPPGAQPPNTWDCSKLISWAYKQIGVSLTAYTYTMADECDPVPGVSIGSTNNLQPGDLLFYFEGTYDGSTKVHHVSMYIGNDLVVHAGSPVKTEPIWAAQGGSGWFDAHFSFARRVRGIGEISSDTTSDTDTDSNQRVVRGTRKVRRDAVALSSVHGTPQTGRFAVLNLANETVFIGSDSTNTLVGADQGILQVVGKTIIPGDQYEVKKSIPGGKNSYEITLDTELIQSPDQANAIASMISRSFSYQYKSIEVKIFGNPLVQLGDIIKFNYYSGKVTSDSDEFYIITKINHSFKNGLETTLTIKPLIQTVSVV